MAKLAKQSSKKQITGADTVVSIMEYVITIICGALFIFVPLYMKNGFYQIGAAKYDMYKWIVLIGLGIMAALAILYVILFRKQINLAWLRQNVSSLDGMMLLYLLCVCISFALCEFKSSAIWGYEGWRMGLVSQLTFVALYFFVSRFCKDGKALLIVLCATSTIVFVLGVLNRFLIDPLGVYNGLETFYKVQFLSTLGQSSWYSSFVCTVLPIGLYFYWAAKSKYEKWLSGLYCILGFATLVTQNSDSAYIALVCMLMALFCFSVQNAKKMYRFFTITLFFFLATRTIYVFSFFLNTEIIEQLDTLTLLLIRGNMVWVLFLCNVFILLLIRLLDQKDRYSVKVAVTLRNIIVGILILGIALSVLCLYLSGTNKLPGNIAVITDQIPYLTWNDAWGNTRGFTWRVTWSIFRRMEWKYKLFGVGPECYPMYTYSRYREEISVMFGSSILSNAHNEWYNAMVNYGLIGAVAYLGVFIMAIRRFVRNCEKPLLIGILACTASYIGHNFFCYQQVLCTPFIICMIGIGESVIRRAKVE